MNTPPPIRFADGEAVSAGKLNRLIELATARYEVKRFPPPVTWIHPFKILPKPTPEDESEQRDTDWRTVRVHAGNVNGQPVDFCDAAAPVPHIADIVIPANVTDYAIFIVALLSDQCGDGASGRGTPPCHSYPGTNWINAASPQITRLFIAHGADENITMDGYDGPYRLMNQGGPNAGKFNESAPFDFEFGLIESGGDYREVIKTYPAAVPTFDVFTPYDERYIIPAGTPWLCPGESDCVSTFYGIGNGFARCRIGRVSTVDGELQITEQRVRGNLTLALCGTQRLSRRPSWASIYFVTRTMLVKRPEFFSPDNAAGVLAGDDVFGTCGKCLENDFDNQSEWCAPPASCPSPETFNRALNRWALRVTRDEVTCEIVGRCCVEKDWNIVHNEWLADWTAQKTLWESDPSNAGIEFPQPHPDTPQPGLAFSMSPFEFYQARCEHDARLAESAWLNPEYDLCGT